MKKSQKNQSSVRVIVRIRPFNAKEKKNNKLDKLGICGDSSTNTGLKGGDKLIKVKDNTIQLANKDKFVFDEVFDENSTQEEVFNDVGAKIVKNAFDGYNSCLFAYGQTGCFEKDTDIMLFNGEYKKIQDIVIGDKIMGDDSTMRIVKELFHGHSTMYKIKRELSDESLHNITCYVVNENHILVLYYKDQVIELPLPDYLKLPNKVKKKLQCFTTTVGTNYRKNLKTFKKMLSQIANHIKILKIYDNYESLISINLNVIKKKIDYKYFLQVIKLLGYKINITQSGNLIINLFNCHIVTNTSTSASATASANTSATANTSANTNTSATASTSASATANTNTSTSASTSTTTPVVNKIVFNKNYIANHTKYDFSVEKLNYGEYYGFSINGNRRFIGAGYNVLRNSGKSTSMFGDEKIGPGIIPRICDALFINTPTESARRRSVSFAETDVNSDTRADDATPQKITRQVELSYFEIYNEEVYDLLNGASGKLKVRQHPTYGPYVENLKQIIVPDSKSIMKLIAQGNKERSTAKTLMNACSSRSHAIVIIYFTQIYYETNSEFGGDADNEASSGANSGASSGPFGGPFRKLKKVKEIMSKINLVDLAGSERTELSGVVGENFKEALEINKSLLTLGIVINSLAKSAKTSSKKGILKKKEPQVIQFRNSTLTWILKESLSGNSKTYMLANISPSSLYYDETLSTLTYAQNAKQIVNNVSVNENQNSKIISILKEEIKSLKNKLNNANSQDMREISEELAERELLIREKEKTWEEKLRESQLYNEKIKQEFTIQQEELKQQLLLEMSGAVSAVEQIKKEEYEKKQNEFEKKKIVETAVELHKYYETSLSEIKDKYEKQQQALELQQQALELQQQKKLAEELEKLEARKNELEARKKELETEQEHERELLKLEREQYKKEQMKQLTEEYEKRILEIEKLEKKKNELIAEREHERAEIALERENIRLQLAVEREKERHQLEEYKRQIEQERQQERERLNSESLAEIEILKKNNNLLKESLNLNQQNLQIQMRQYLNDRMSLTNQIQQLQSKLSNNDKLAEEIEGITKKKNEEEAQYNILKENCRELDEKLMQDTIKLNELNSTYANLKTSHAELQTSHDILKSSHADLQTSHANLQTSHADLQSSHADLQSSHVELQEKVINIKTEYEELQIKLEKDKLEYSQLLLQKEILHTEIINLRSQLYNNINELKSSLSSEDLLKIKNGFDVIYERLPVFEKEIQE